jgi:hypothetical protein
LLIASLELTMYHTLKEESKTKNMMFSTATILTSENEINEDTPRFPRVVPKSCFFKACIVVASSGREVPRPTIVAPIIDGGKPIELAMSTELSTTSFESNIMTARLMMNFRLTIVVGLLGVTSSTWIRRHKSIIQTFATNTPYYYARV